MKASTAYLYILGTCLFASSASGQNSLDRYKFEGATCFHISDALDGRSTTWNKTDLADCGFNEKNPDRLEYRVLNDKCVQTDVFVSKTGHGELKRWYPFDKARTEMPLEKCGFDLKKSVKGYVLIGSKCFETETFASTFANIPDRVVRNLSGVPIGKCGFDSKNERTMLELRSNSCVRLLINSNEKGERISKTLGDLDVKECGIDFTKPPVDVIYARFIAPRMGFAPSVDACQKMSTYISDKGLGVVTKVEAVAKDAAGCIGSSVNAPPRADKDGKFQPTKK